MSITDRGTLGPGFDRRLRAALDSIVPAAPHFLTARYRSTTPARAHLPRRVGPPLVAIGALATVALSAFAATGSPNPAVWTQRAGSIIQSVSHTPETSPNQPQSPSSDPSRVVPVSTQAGTSQADPPSSREIEPSNKPQPSQKAKESLQPDESPRPDAFQRPSPSPEPSDSPGNQSRPEPTPSPTPHDHGGAVSRFSPSDFGWPRRF